MEEYNVLILMEQDKESGFVTNTIDSYVIPEGMEYIRKVFAREEGADLIVHLLLTTKDVEDWEFEAIFDYYDTDIFGDLIAGVTDVEDEYNPTWELTLPFTEDREAMAERLNAIVGCHREELAKVLEEIQPHRATYEAP